MLRLSSAFAQSSHSRSSLRTLPHVQRRTSMPLIRMLPRALFIAAASCLLAPGLASADPILRSGLTVTFPFTVQVTVAFGPLQTLFGRSFVIGDTLSGRISFDGTSGPDQDPWAAHGV